ncbi:hypothetical protein F5144DRAFT_630104 [Chaetomium tenue]|uniref:Uncharacterized protein n=1 Tax=Chaetomium tenue TaxID=1854479 RepID=A0ACB7P7J0_9PEZI|nr:hypothetical protein F5144DRAFT_630104 [Chaetomium globosum]
MTTTTTTATPLYPPPPRTILNTSASTTTPLLFPPASIPPPPLSTLLAHLPQGQGQGLLPSPTSLRLPTTWRCGTCGTLHSVPALLATGSTGRRARADSNASAGSEVSSDMDVDEEERGGDGPGGEGGVRCVCRRPALQAVYDQLGELYLFWRDDPAVADLSVPRMAEEARWRVRRAGGDGWWVGGVEVDGKGVECGL